MTQLNYVSRAALAARYTEIESFLWAVWFERNNAGDVLSLVEKPLHTSAVKEKDEVRKESPSLFVKRRVAPVDGHMPRNLFSLAQAYLLDGEIIMVIR